MKCHSHNAFFDTISTATRLDILELLKEKPMSVSEIVKALGEEQSNISHNLKCLVDCHFLEVKRDGKKRIYSLNKETILPLLQLAEKHVQKYCCKECNKKHD